MLYYELLGRASTGLTPTRWTAGIYAKDEHYNPGVAPVGIMAYAANRIWCEQDGNVVYLKHKGGNPDGREVDMKEFMFIKLTASMI